MTTAPVHQATDRSHVARSAAMLGGSIVVVLGLLVGAAAALAQAVDLVRWFAGG